MEIGRRLYNKLRHTLLAFQRIHRRLLKGPDITGFQDNLCRKLLVRRTNRYRKIKLTLYTKNFIEDEDFAYKLEFTYTACWQSFTFYRTIQSVA